MKKIMMLLCLTAFVACTNTEVTKINKERIKTMDKYLYEEYNQKENKVKEYMSLEEEANKWQEEKATKEN